MCKYQIDLKVVLVSIFAVLLVGCGGGSSTSNTRTIYTAIFDAGSSGTRLTFFRVIPGNGGYPSIGIIAKYNDKNQDVPDDDGINDFLNNKGFIVLGPDESLPAGCPGTTNLGPTDVNPCVIQPLLKQLDQSVVALGLSKSQVKVELFATAGMRTEEKYNGGLHDASTIQTFYDNIKTYVVQWGYDAGQFKTINGNSEEGLWTWINLNDQYFNAFGGNTTYWTQAPTTRGNFEVGGSSMQIAFPTTQISPSNDNNVYTVTINGYTYNVYSKTYLGLGGDDMRKFMRLYGYTSASGYNSGIDCFGRGADSTNTTESSGIRLFYNSTFYPQSTTISSNAVDNTWTPLVEPLVTPPSPNPLDWTTGTVGAFNATTCANKYQAISTAVMALPRNSYGTVPNQQTPSSYSSFVDIVKKSSSAFVGIDGFYWAPQFLGLLANCTTPVCSFTQAQYESAYNSKCPSGSYVGSGKNLRNTGSCANATYMKDFLWRTNGLFTSTNSPVFEGSAPNEYGKVETLTWSRGYLLQKYAN
jgi:hypothetical protein